MAENGNENGTNTWEREKTEKPGKRRKKRVFIGSVGLRVREIR